MTCHLAPNGGDLLGLLKKFRVTKENEKESEIFTLANLDNGCIRKFIVKKVDESAFLASINRRNKEDSKSLTDENENTAVVGHEEGGDGCPLVPPSPTLPRRNVPAAPIANGHAKPIERKSSSNFKLGCDDDSDDCSSMTVEDKDDPGVINPAFTYEEEEDDDLGRGDGSTTSARSSPETSPSPSPKLHFSSMSPRPSPRQSPVSHRSGNLSHRSSVSSVRKGILKKSGSSSTINMEMVNLGLQNAAIAAGNAANLNGYQRARFTDPYDDNFVPMDTHRFVGSSEENNYAMQQKSLGGHRVKFILETGKPDHVHGSYDDIRIEKMERERIERIESAQPPAHGMPPLTPPHTPPLHPLTPHSLASLGSAAQHHHTPTAPPHSACRPDPAPPPPKGPGTEIIHSSPPPRALLQTSLTTEEDESELCDTSLEPSQPRGGEDRLDTLTEAEASLQEQRQELRALLLQDLANFRKGHGYLLAKELEEKVAALRLSKSVLHRVKILNYLRLRERHSGSLHPALLAAGPDTLPPGAKTQLRRPCSRLGRMHGNPNERSLTPIPEEEMEEDILTATHPCEPRPVSESNHQQACGQHTTHPDSPSGQTVGKHGEALWGEIAAPPSPDSPRTHDRPTLIRRFLKKNEKVLPQGHAASLEGSPEGPLRVSSISHQYLASDPGKEAELQGGSLSKMVLKIEINCMNAWPDAAHPPLEPSAVTESSSVPASGSHTTVTDIILDTVPSPPTVHLTPTASSDSLRSSDKGAKETSIFIQPPQQSSPASIESSHDSGEPPSPKILIRDDSASSDSGSCQAFPPANIAEPAGDGKTLQPSLLSSGPTDYLTWAAEVTREEASSGKDLEVTNVTDRGGKKCLLFCAAMLVLTGAVIVAGLYGSGKLKIITELGGQGITSGLSGGAATTQPPTSSPTIAYVPNAIEVKFKIDNHNFTTDLTNVDSKAYKTMVKDLEAELTKILFPEPVLHNGKANLNLKIIKFEPGSIKCTFRIGWSFFDEQNEQEAPLNLTIIREIFENRINNSFVFLHQQEYRVPPDSIDVDRLVDKCYNNQSLCSHGCKFSYENLRFTCTCPDYLYSINTTTCIHPNKTTTTSTTTSTTTEIAIKDVFNQVIKHVGGDFVAIKLEDLEANTDTEIEAPPTGKKTEEESETSEDSKNDEQPKPAEVIVDGTTNATVNATTDGQLPPVNVTEATTTTTTSTTTTSTTTTSTTTTSPVTVPPASNETITEVSADNTTEATNISLISTTTVVAETNSSATKTTTTETVISKEEQQTTTSQKPTSEEVTIIHEGLEPVLPEHTTIKTENTSVDEIPATSTPTPNVTIVAQDVAPVTTTTEPTVMEDSEPESEPEEAVPGVEEVSNTTHHSNVSISTPEVVNDTISEILQETFINRSALFPENFVSPGTRLEDIISFTNIPGKAIIVLDLSALRPGDSPGNAGLQEVEDESSHSNVTAVNETQTGTSVTEESPLHNATTHDAGTKESVSEATTQPVVATSVTTEIPSTSTSSSTTTTTTTTTTERHVVIVNASEVSAHEDDLGRDTGEEQVSKEVVTIPAVPYEGNPIFASKTPPSVRTTTTTTSTTPPTTTTTTTTTTSPTTTTSTTTTTQPSVMTENSTTPATTTTTLDYDTKGEEAPVENRDTSILDIAFIASSDLSTMARNTSHDTPAATTTAPTTTTTTTTTTTVIEGITNTSQESPGTNVTAIDTTKDDPALVHINKEVAATSTNAPPKVLCHEDQVECINGTSTWGRCIPRNSRCNSVPDCSDKSDELDCKENNCFGNFQCRDGECIERLYICDGVTNCQDGDDELNCESWQCKEDELKCGGNSPSPCIPLSLRCDGQPDCIDHSDELNCTDVCRSDEFRCSEGWCIPHVRTCDGRPDCHNGEDEKNCDCSGLDETQCAAGGCVPTFHLCDGLRQCHDGSDEWNCVRIDNSTRQLEVRSGKNRWSAVCGEGWTSKWTDQVCQQLGGSASLSTEMRRVSESVPRPRVQLLQKAVSGGYTPLQFVLKSDCSSDTLVHLSCEEHSCGSWSLGDDVLEEHQLSANTRPPATEGQWPSLALLLRTHPNKNDTHAQGQFCSASIVAPSWILAAYSCLSSKENGLDLGTWAVASGTASPTASTQFHYVGKIVPFPGRVRTGGLWTGDAVLLRLTEPLDLGPNSQPVCVPNTPPVNTAQCVVAGWRRTDEGVGSQSQFLHHLPMPTLALDACNTTHYPGRLNPTHTCVGFSDAQHAPCHGDEGSPLMCRSETGAWRLEGLLTHHTCYGRARHPAIFTALHALQPWLNNTIGTPHVPNGASTSTTTTTTTTSTTTTPTITTTTSTTTTPPTTTVGSTTTTTTTTTSDATTSTSTTTTSPTTTTTPPPGDGTGSANSTDLEEALPPLSSPGMAPL